MTTESHPHDKAKARKHKLIGFASICLIIFLIYFIHWYLVQQFYEITDDAYVNGNLVQVMPKISGHVNLILADETQLVKKGQPIIVLDKTDAEIAFKDAASKLALTARQVSNLYQNVDQLRANLKVEQDALFKATNDYKRRQGLVVNKVISEEDLQHAKIAAESAESAYELAKNQLASAVSLVINTDLYHHPTILQAGNEFRNAYLTLQRTTIYAPETGYIAKRSVQVGQQVSPNTVLMVIVPLNQLWVNANYKESQLKHFRINQPASMASDLYGDDVVYHGKVVGLSPGTGSVFDLLPPQNATGNWIKITQRLPVRIQLDAKELIKHPLRIGLSMVVTVDTHNRTGAMLTALPKEEIIYETKNYGDQLKKADEMIEKILEANAPNIHYSP